ncbi:MAG TPA: twin-arginine translocation signal domain-containing protein, partial [Stellaceae bacterium]|nr:twin-arginine translocation signal domain-containing protein [Stellaceae bacterium]
MTTSRRDFLVQSAAAAGVLTGPRAWAEAAGWSLPEKKPFKAIDNGWIPLKDGTRLNVRLWLPDGVPARKVPAVW